MVTPQEVRRREVAEAEVSEARGYLSSSRQELQELRHLAWKLEQMGRNRYRPESRKRRNVEQRKMGNITVFCPSFTECNIPMTIFSVTALFTPIFDPHALQYASVAPR